MHARTIDPRLVFVLKATNKSSPCLHCFDHSNTQSLTFSGLSMPSPHSVLTTVEFSSYIYAIKLYGLFLKYSQTLTGRQQENGTLQACSEGLLQLKYGFNCQSSGPSIPQHSNSY